MLAVTRFRGGFTVGPASAEPEDLDGTEAERLRRIALEAVERFREAARLAGHQIRPGITDADLERIAAPVNAAYDLAHGAIYDAHDASGAGGDLPFVVADNGDVLALVSDDESDPHGFIWPFIVIPASRATQPRLWRNPETTATP
jgi:hypothetical protein